MADQASPGPVASVGQEGGALAQPGTASYQAPEPFHGRPVSWVAVSIIMAGFLAGGLGLVFGPTWWLFWAGAARRSSAGCWRWGPTSSTTGTKSPGVRSPAQRRAGENV